MFPLLFLSSALATPDSHYNTDNVAAKSSLFAKVSEASAPHYRAFQSTTNRVSYAIDKMDVALAVFPAKEQRDYLIFQNATYVKYSQAAYAQGDSYNEAFFAAVERSLAQIGGRPSECAQTRMQRMTRQKNICPGENIDSQIVSLIDKDPVLIKDVDRLINQPWPTLNLELSAQSPQLVSGTEYTVRADRLISVFMNAQIEKHSDDLGRNKERLEDLLIQGNKEAIEKSKAYVSDYRKKCQTEGDKMMEILRLTVKRKSKKDKRLNALGVCTTNTELGGCTGTDITKDVISIMMADRKVIKALKKAAFRVP